MWSTCLLKAWEKVLGNGTKVGVLVKRVTCDCCCGRMAYLGSKVECEEKNGGDKEK